MLCIKIESDNYSVSLIRRSVTNIAKIYTAINSKFSTQINMNINNEVQVCFLSIVQTKVLINTKKRVEIPYAFYIHFRCVKTIIDVHI